MAVDVVLLVAFLAVVVLLFAVEGYTVAKGLPTISERIQRMGRSAPLVSVIVSFFAGALLIHFFG